MFKTKLARIWQLSFTRWFVTCCVCLCMVAAAMQIPGLRRRDFHLRYLNSQLASLEDEALPAQFQRMLKYEQDGLPFVVRAMIHERGEVVARAELALERELNQWKTIPVRQSAARVEQLMAELAKINSQLSAPSRLFASQVAVESLAWPISPDSQNARRIARSAQSIIEATPLRTLAADRPTTPSPSTKAFELPVSAPYEPTESPEPFKVPESSTSDESPTTSSFEDAGGNQKEAAILPVAPTIQTNAKPAIPTPGPAPLQPTPLPHQSTPHVLQPVPTSPIESTKPVESTIPIAKPTQPVLPEKDDSDATHPFEEEMGQLKQLIAKNGTATPQFLTDSGFSTVDSRFAQWVKDAPYKELRKGLQSLPTTRDLRADIWLVWFSQQSDARLRTLSASIMASSADQRLLAYLKAWKTWESDAAVRQHLDKLFDLMERR